MTFVCFQVKANIFSRLSMVYCEYMTPKKRSKTKTTKEPFLSYVQWTYECLSAWRYKNKISLNKLKQMFFFSGVLVCFFILFSLFFFLTCSHVLLWDISFVQRHLSVCLFLCLQTSTSFSLVGAIPSSRKFSPKQITHFSYSFMSCLVHCLNC